MSVHNASMSVNIVTKCVHNMAMSVHNATMSVHNVTKRIHNMAMSVRNTTKRVRKATRRVIILGVILPLFIFLEIIQIWTL